jgi:hypothetical protein
MPNWTTVKRKDKNLRLAEGAASTELAELRWENTLGATPKIKFTVYAREVGIDEGAVRRYARAHENRMSHPEMTIGEALVRASVSEEQAEVVDVVARSRGISHETARGYHRDEVRAVRAIARERADESGRTVREEAEEFVEFGEKVREQDAGRRERRRAQSTMQWIEVEGRLLSAKRALEQAARVDADWNDTEKEFVAHSLDVLRSLINLIEARIIGTAKVDWDTELAKLSDS